MPARPRPSAVYGVIAVLSWPILRLLYRLRARGQENLPAEGGFVLAANHYSSFDPWPLGLPLFPRRFLRFMAKSELFWPPLSWIARGGGAFPVRRGERDTAAIETAVRFYEEPPAGPGWAEAFASVEPGVPHNEARDQIWEALTAAVTPSPELRAALHRAWPVLSAVVTTRSGVGSSSIRDTGAQSLISRCRPSVR